MKCINRNHPNYIAIAKSLNNAVAANMLINKWQEETSNDNIIPTISEFNSWKELAPTETAFTLNNDLLENVLVKGNEQLYKDNNLLAADGQLKNLSNLNKKALDKWVDELNIKTEYKGKYHFKVSYMPSGTKILIQKYKDNKASQLETKGVPDEQLHELMQQFCDKLGINVNIVDAVDRDGNLLDYNAVAKFTQSNMKAVIDLVKGKLGYDTFTEETVHFLTWMMRGTPLYKSMFNDIVNQPIYNTVKENYAHKYTTETQFREEAITQMIVQTLLKQYKEGTKLTENQYNEITNDVNRVSRWWNKVLAYLKNLFNKIEVNEYDLAAMKLLFGDTNDLNLSNINSNEEMLQLADKPIQEQIDAYYEAIKSRNIVLEESTHKYTEEGVEFKESLTESISKNEQFPDRTTKEKIRDNFLKENGTKAHKDFQNSFIRQVEQLNGEIKTARELFTDEDTRYEINKYVKNLINSYPKGTKFIIETPIGTKDKKLAGTPDVVIIYDENGKVKIDILDYKFVEFTKVNGVVIDEEIKPYKKKKYTKQLQGIKTILQEEYGINVPINGYILPMSVNVGFDKASQNYTIASIEVGNLNYDKDKLYLNRIPLETNKTDDKTVNSILDGLLATKERIRKRQTSGDSKADLNKQARLKDINEAIKKIILTKQLDSFFDEAISEIDLAIENISDENISEIGDLLAFYKNLNFSDYKNKNTDKENIDSKISDFKHKVDDLESAYLVELNKSAEKIAELTGVEDVNIPQKDISWWNKTLSYFSTIDNPYIKALYKLVIKAKDDSKVKYEEALTKISKLSNGVLEYAKSNGIDPNKAFEIFIKRDKYNNIVLLDMFSKASRDKIQKAREDKDYITLRKNLIFDELKYNERVANDKAFYTEKYKNYADSDKKIQQLLDTLEKQFDVRKSEYALINKNNRYLKLNDKTLELNEDYKKIQSNPDLKAFYDYFIETVQESRKKLGLDYDAKFIPQVVQSMFEAVKDNNYNFTDKFWNEVSTSQQGSYGELNSLTGNPDYKIAVPYNNKIGKEASTDLGKVLALWTKAALDAEHLGEIEDSVHILKQALQQQKFFRTSALGKKMFNNEKGEFEIIKADDTKTLAAFIGFMNQALYNIQITDDVAFKKTRTKKLFNEDGTPKMKDGKQETEEYEMNVSLAKFIQKIQSYLSAKSLGLNVISATANIGGGYLNGLYEGEKGIHYNKKQFLKASKLFTAGKLGDVKVMTAIRYFDILGDMEGFNKANALSVNAMDRFFTYDKIYALQKGGDTLIHNTVLISLMQSHGINIDGKIKNLRLLPEGTKSILDSMELNGDNLVIKGITDNKDNTEYLNFRRKALSVSQKIIGASPMYDIRLVNQSILGRILMQFRGWMPRMIEERGGTLKYNNNLEEFEKGKFISFGQFLIDNIAKNSFELLKQFGDIGNNIEEILGNKWELLDEEVKQKYLKNSANEAEAKIRYIALEKGNIKATLLELKTILGVLGLIMLMNGGDDDDKKTGFNKFANKVADRMYNELSFFIVPSSINTIINKPAPIMSVLTDGVKLGNDFIGQSIGVLTNSEEMMKKNKPIKQLGKMFPVGNEIVKDLSIVFDDKYWE